MGGKAFVSHVPPVLTPRMTPEVYGQVLNQTRCILRQHYSQVECPIEPPGKASFGDVDFLVAGPLTKDFDRERLPWDNVTANLVRVLGAVASLTPKGAPVVHIAIPWPSSTATPSTAETIRSLDEEEQRYVQIDIHHLLSPEQFNWELFHSAHGDMWNILGSTIRPFGLTVNDRGLYLRIPEIEKLDRKKSLIFLTEKPPDVLGFMGLDEKQWWRPFKDEETMFEYAASCKLFSVRKNAEEEENHGIVDNAPSNESLERGDLSKKGLKYNDRQRMSKRPIFNRWISDFIPRCREAGRYTEQKYTREQVREDAFKTFGVQKEYQENLTAWRLVRHREEIWKDFIKGTIPTDEVDPQLRAAAVKVMKQVIMEADELEGAACETVRPGVDGFYDTNAVRAFVEMHWKMAGELGMARQQVKAAQMMKEKEAKKRQRSEEASKKMEQGADS